MVAKERYLVAIRLSAWIEILCFFLICFVIALIFQTDFNFFTVSPHPFWIIVILISAQYGTVAGLLAALVSTLVYLAGPLPKQTILQEWSDYFYLLAKEPLLWFVTALVLGELRMRHIRERDTLRTIVDEAKAKEQQLAESYEALKRIKERLEVHVAAQMPTMWMVINDCYQLESCKKEEILPCSFELIKQLIVPEKASIFLIKNKQLVLEGSTGWEEVDTYSKSFDQNTALYHEIVEGKREVSLTTGDAETLKNEGMLAVPIQKSPTSEVMGMVKIELMPLHEIKLNTMEALRVIGLFIGEAYAR